MKKRLMLGVAAAFVASSAVALSVTAASAPTATGSLGTAAIAPRLSMLAGATASSISATCPATIAHGSSGVVSGKLTPAQGGAIAGRQVTLVASGYHQNGPWWPAGTATTSSDGTYSFVVAPTFRTYYHVRFSGDEVFQACTTETQPGPYPLVISPEVSLTAPTLSSPASAGTSVTASGHLEPRHDTDERSVQVVCERLEEGAWVRRATFWATNSDYSDHTRYSSELVLPRAGSWRLRALHIEDVPHAATFSDPVDVSVAKGTPTCSIEGSDTTPFRRPVILTGKLANAARQPLTNRAVTLEYAYSTDATAWASVATTTTSASGGDYFFNVVEDAPSRTTWYRVRFAGDGDYTAVTSAAHKVAVPARISAPMFWAPPYVDKLASVSGIVEPKRPAGTGDVRLEFERKEGGVWVPKLVLETLHDDYWLWPATRAESTSTRYYSRSVSLPLQGAWRVRAHLLPSSLNAETFSEWTYIRVD